MISKSNDINWTEVLSGHTEIIRKYEHFNGLHLSGALEEFSISSLFLSSKMQKSTYWRKEAFSAVFI